VPLGVLPYKISLDVAVGEVHFDTAEIERLASHRLHKLLLQQDFFVGPMHQVSQLSEDVVDCHRFRIEADA
jgi:hypothetical protein